MISRWFEPFAAHEGGNYAVIFALTALPLMAGAGASFDYVQASGLQSELVRSRDQAGIAGMQEWVKGKSKRDVEKTIKAFMLANLDPEHKDALKVSVKLPGQFGRNDRELKISARLEFKPLMAPLYGAVTGQGADAYEYVIQVP
jgi:Putative Flp pilus-assembly TadE/G-like